MPQKNQGQPQGIAPTHHDEPTKQIDHAPKFKSTTQAIRLSTSSVVLTLPQLTINN